MTPPQISGYKIKDLIGEGSSGAVYMAEKDGGGHFAVKVYDGISSNPSLVESRIMRIMTGGAQNVTVPILARALDVRPACVVMPLFADQVTGGEFSAYRALTLQIKMVEFLETEKSWGMVEALAKRLGVMHGVKVAHGNLKPGNIFLTEDEELLLSDYAQGLVPGVHHLPYSDALLYTPPEQLRYPEGYLEEAGYRWDVYAFGVLAFRLLTGKFPRCNEMFQKVSPPPGENQRFLIEADYEGIAEGLEKAGRELWPTEAADEREERRRELIHFCLSLDPRGRPTDMCELWRSFRRIDNDLKIEQSQKVAVSKVELADQKRNAAQKKAKTLGVCALVLGLGWGGTEVLRRVQLSSAAEGYRELRDSSASEIQGLKDERDQAVSSKVQALTVAESLRDDLAREKGKAAEELKMVHLTNDQLFSWLLERGEQGVPTLVGRQWRLIQLREALEKRLIDWKDRPALERPVVRLKFRLAEVHLAAGETEKGIYLLKKTLREAPGVVEEGEEAMMRLRLAMAVSEQDAVGVDILRQEALTASQKAWEAESPELIRAEAALALIDARYKDGQKNGEGALAAYELAMEKFTKLRDLFPENLALRTHLARGYQESALAAEGLGVLGSAAALRGRAAEEFLVLIEKTGMANPEYDYLVASAMSAKALAEWSEGDVFEADRLAKLSVKKLQALRVKLPDDLRILIDLSSQRGIVATSLRDEGRLDESEKLLRSTVNELSEGKAKRSWKGRFLLSSLKWQLSSLLAQREEKEEAIQLGVEAYEELKLIFDAKPRHPRHKVVYKSLAYLCADMGMLTRLFGQHDRAVEFFKESRGYWLDLIDQDVQVAEYQEGLNWVREQLRDLGVK